MDQTRSEHRGTNGGAIRAMLALDTFIRNSGLDRPLLQLVKLRAAQVAGCQHGVEVHTAEARARGENEARLLMLPAWRMSPLYSERERAALAWTDALAGAPDRRMPNEDFELIDSQFTPDEVGKLMTVISLAIAWNRLAMGLPASTGRTGRLAGRPALRLCA